MQSAGRRGANGAKRGGGTRGSRALGAAGPSPAACRAATAPFGAAEGAAAPAAGARVFNFSAGERR